MILQFLFWKFFKNEYFYGFYFPENYWKLLNYWISAYFDIRAGQISLYIPDFLGVQCYLRFQSDAHNKIDPQNQSARPIKRQLALQFVLYYLKRTCVVMLNNGLVDPYPHVTWKL